MHTQLMAIVAESNRRRYYLAPNEEHEKAANIPRPKDAPDGELSTHPQYMGAPRYGLTNLADLFTSRQLTVLCTFSDLIQNASDDAFSHAMREGISYDNAKRYSRDLALYLAFAVDKAADRNSTICGWEPRMNRLRGTFQRQALPMAWDFAEANPFGNAGGDLAMCVMSLVEVLDGLWNAASGKSEQMSAADYPYESYPYLIATDPPYYDNVPYADLSDFFYLWLRRSLRIVFPSIFTTVLSPKQDELVADQIRLGGRASARNFFEEGFRRVFSHMRASALDGYPISVFYAFKQSESWTDGDASTGWETLLEGMIQSGWTVSGTWPMRTELGNRIRGRDSNALASSVVLACRPRPDNAGTIDRRGFLGALRSELPQRLRELQQGNIAPVDLAQAAIGPGMAVFSRYRQVSEADGKPMKVRTALVLINQVLDEVLAEQEGDFDTDSRWCVKWFDEYEWQRAEYGRAETLATALNTSVAGLERAGVIKQPAGKVWLIKPGDLPASYDPAADERPTVWEAVLHLSKRLEEQGIDAAGEFMARLALAVDMDPVKELAYLLHNISERRRRAASALRFNSLVTSWPDIVAASRSTRVTSGDDQMTIDYTADDADA